MRTDSVEFLLKAPWFPLSPVLLTDGWSSENWQDETTRCLLVRLLVHALRKKNLPQGNLSNLLSSPTNQVCHRELTTQVCHSFIAFFFIITRPIIPVPCFGRPGPGSLSQSGCGLPTNCKLLLPPSYHPLAFTGYLLCLLILHVHSK